jgi:ribonuclease HI
MGWYGGLVMENKSNFGGTNGFFHPQIFGYILLLIR